ncbi:glycoside hydrolase family 3 N-terminal domain-containing protein [Sulfurospirillum arsenophilum]|uniref:glycoside hydrolase family 3 N-terminal domain-containing protein n=1 Tax=Sulfurospirillum arsenophilum TaxID=56698 RepID=UPI0005A90CB3|nr:glycoside hydrolase family 3 N-terminal domain-containing protein [Sulfurospirillum arsenophilum]
MLKFLLTCLLFASFLHAKTPPLEDMIAQMIIIGFDGTKEGDKWVDQIAKDIKREKIGGVFLMDKNIQNPVQLKKLNEYLKAQAPKDLPLIVAVEHEGGEKSLFEAKKGFSEVPSAYELFKNKDIAEAEQLYQKLSHDLAKSGINVNFAPVLDLQPKKDVYENAKLQRSYSSYEEIVTTYAMLFINALHAEGVTPVVKYFPTAGANLWNNFSSEEDVTSTWRFEQLKPYYDLIAYGKMDAVLMSHAMHKEIDSNNPTLFSKLVIQGLLRDKMHFEGVVFTDNLRTHSIASSVDFKQRVIRSIDAGADILVFTNYFADNASMTFTINKIITDAIKSGELSTERIALSYERIVSFKQKLSKRGSHVN